MSGRRSGTLYWLPLILDDERLDATDTLLLLALADHVDEDGCCFVSIRRLASRGRCSYGTARRHLASIEARGYIVRSPRRRDDGGNSTYDYTLRAAAFEADADALATVDPPRNMRGGPRASGRAGGRAHQGARAEQPNDEQPRSKNPVDVVDAGIKDGAQLELVHPPSEPSVADRARAIAQHVFENKTPRPAQKFVAVQTVARALLDAGHDASMIERAMCAVPTISTRWCESWIAQQTKTRPTQQRVSQARDVPAGRIVL